MEVRLSYSLTARNKDLKSNRRRSWYNGIFHLNGSDYEDHIRPLLFLQLLKCYTNRNKEVALNDLIEADRGYNQYWSPYINASECRKIVKYFRDAKKRGTVYMVEKPFKITQYGDVTKAPCTLVITKHPYKQETLFLKALCNDGIRSINGKESHFFNKVLKFMEQSKGVWL